MSVESRRRDPFCLLVFREPFSSLGLLIVHQRTYVRGGCAGEEKEEKRRDGRGGESERKTAAWKTSGRQPVSHHLDEEARASPVPCDGGGRKGRTRDAEHALLCAVNATVATQPQQWIPTRQKVSPPLPTLEKILFPSNENPFRDFRHE